MLLYTCFRFSEVMYQMFLTVRGAVQLRLVLRSCRLMTRKVSLEMSPPPPPPTPRFFFFGVNLDFSSGIFDL